jgi:hypothetical protein
MPDQEPLCMEMVGPISAEPVLPGFLFGMNTIWQADF